jgi:hypothetical protein
MSNTRFRAGCSSQDDPRLVDRFEPDVALPLRVELQLIAYGAPVGTLRRSRRVRRRYGDAEHGESAVSANPERRAVSAIQP